MSPMSQVKVTAMKINTYWEIAGTFPQRTSPVFTARRKRKMSMAVIDTMAREGIRFTHFYSANPVCSPSRAALLTGRYPTRVGVPRVLNPKDTIGLPDSETTIAQMLKPFPQYTSVSAPYNNNGQSNYQSMQWSLQQRLSRGLTFNVNHTFSKAQGTINGFRSAFLPWEERERLLIGVTREIAALRQAK